MTEELHKKLPDAVITAACTIADNTTHGAWAIRHPSGTKAPGVWLARSRRRLVRGIQLDDPDCLFPWYALAQLALLVEWP
ncbi:hypothetical protein [Streptomyces inhibens]|uniref:hypothetical protein n=1 Tax=Streptomyces inhibens TaxID=2293571 RepID=UPI001EE77387|nr:hypothetical protein [Streptomyces inhibens]UKY54553.1 hypothetical protein KI385_40945 [Streptomyces inhibens]